MNHQTNTSIKKTSYDRNACDIGIVHFRGLVVSAVLEDREHHLAVVDVHLAPVGFHVHVLATLVGGVSGGRGVR